MKESIQSVFSRRAISVVDPCLEQFKCPLPHCTKKVIHILRHLRNCHGWSESQARTATSRFRIRKKYVFSNDEMAAAGNRKQRKVCPEGERTTKKPCRKMKLCPLPKCSTRTDRLPQHLQKTHKLKRDDAMYKKALSLAKVLSRPSKPHIFLRMKEERRNLSQGSSMSQDDGTAKGADLEDAFPAHSNVDELAHEDAHHNTHVKADESYRGSEDGITGSANQATKVLNEFQTWLLSPDGEKKDKKTAKQHVAQLKNILSIVGGGTQLESLIDASKMYFFRGLQCGTG